MFPEICFVWVGIWIIFIFCFAIIGNSTEDELDLTNHTQCLVYYNDLKYERCEEYSKGITERLYDDLIEMKEEIKKEINLTNLIWILLFLAPPPLIYFPFKKRWTNYLPKYQGKKGRKKLVIFKPKDIRKDEKGYFVEIPVFKNIILNYKATRNSEFAKYLYLFEIKEHKFKYVVSKKLKGDEKKKKELNDEIWYARFSFSKKPTTGQLSVLFK